MLVFLFMLMMFVFMIAMLVIMMLMFVRMLVMMMVLLVLLMRVGRAFVDRKFDGLDILPLLALPMGVEIADLQLAQFPLEGGGFDAEIAQCADGHIAADARETVEVKNAHDPGR
jgi:hypothetical protein